MKIDRGKAIEVFQNYVKDYHTEDEKVCLKIEHTYRVSSLCGQIARNLMLSDTDVELAWLIGLLHDIGRFEQIKNYGTFIDEESIDHAKYGAEILFAKGKIREFISDSSEDRLIETAVKFHNAYRIPENIKDRERTFCTIIRDADKIDILKVNVEFPLEDIYNITSKELRNALLTEEVLVSFANEQAVLRSLKKTAADHVLGHISLVYELVYPVSLKLVLEQGYLEKLMNFQSENPVTVKQFERVREKMTAYIGRKCKESGYPE